MNLFLKNLKNILLATTRGISKFFAKSHPRILMYHRVLPDEHTDSMPLDTFKEQVRLLKRDFNVISLQRMTQASHIPNNSVVLTFDDGYYDFYYHIYPVLKKYQIPATLFVTTSFIDGEIWFWPDKIRYLLKHCHKDDIYIEECNKKFNLRKEAFSCWDEISSYCLTLSNESRSKFFDKLEVLTKIKIPESVPEEYRALTWGQLEEISGSGLIEVASHTISHQILSKLSIPEMEKEIWLSKKLIEKRLNNSVYSFCYPNGMKGDFNQLIKKVVSDAGYKYALTAYPSFDPLRDMMEINRYPASSDISSFKNSLYGLRYYSFIRDFLKRKLF